MGTIINCLLCSFVVVFAQDEVTLEADRPFLRVQLSHRAHLECCYRGKQRLSPTWHRRQFGNSSRVTDLSDVSHHETTQAVAQGDSGTVCGVLTISSVQMNDFGLYQCTLNTTRNSVHRTHGTYLLVYKPMEKTINLSESTKNKILIAEGLLLLLCVMLPSATLLCQSKRNKELEKKKAKKEEENIYQGLNLDDCCSAYDQIERSQGHGPYEDVGSIMEEEEAIQLEKP
ncbi:B-cell antigen receptor complex-associated protein alpha chain [Pempheris klunzingeri]|uniref:B-cell antigen receptor complex-associated protein alpha chain n=1 Tax=Pempheris klunzingeri TaxID=3127111 RepID=UPI00397EFA29